MRKHLLTTGLLLTVLALLVLAGRHAAADAPNVNAKPSPDLRVNGDIYDQIESGLPLDKVSEWRAKIAFGPNSNATVTIDLIPDGGAGNQIDDGVTSGTVSGQGTKIAVEVFALGVTTPLIGVKIEFDFKSEELKLDKVENSAFLFAIPEPTGVNFAATAPVTLRSSGFIGRAEFSTVADVTGQEFTLGIKSVTLAESAASSDVITTTDAIAFNATQTTFSLSLDANSAAGDQAVTSINISTDTVISIQIFGQNVRNANGLAVRFEYDGSQMTYEGFDVGSVLPNAQALPEHGTTFVQIGIVSLGGQATTNSGLLGTIRFRTTDAFSGTAIRLVRAELGRGGQIESATIDVRVELKLQVLTPDFNRDGMVNFADFLAFAGHFGARQGDGRYDARYDLDSDGAIGFGDFLIFGNSYGKEVSTPGGSGGGGGGSTGIVDIPDANLRAVIADSLGKARNASITRAEMATLTRLDAPNKGIRSLTGLEHATNLQRLELGYVWVNDELVNSNNISNLSPLSNLTNLTWLSLGGNSISSISALSNLTNLTWLSLGGNSISSISALSNLTNLTWLSLGGNSISSISALSNLTNLTWLSLGGNSISSISALSNLTNLTVLGLGGNSISSISALSNLTNLTELHLGNNSISDISALSNLTNLTTLYLWGNRISDISVLSNLTNLKELYLSINSISDISSLSGLTNLTKLYLDRNGISDISALSNLTNLTVLYLYNNSISDISPLEILSNVVDGCSAYPCDYAAIFRSPSTNITPSMTRGMSL